ncbi:hypothetical protein BC832DRAFT_599169 [Gaertneriomyces semiglobifer]|nr:hypothetical protein BC832DRAFT_599169 [Gaertneriomyces semiglobifer]
MGNTGSQLLEGRRIHKRHSGTSTRNSSRPRRHPKAVPDPEKQVTVDGRPLRILESREFAEGDSEELQSSITSEDSGLSAPQDSLNDGWNRKSNWVDAMAGVVDGLFGTVEEHEEDHAAQQIKVPGAFQHRDVHRANKERSHDRISSRDLDRMESGYDNIAEMDEQRSDTILEQGPTKTFERQRADAAEPPSVCVSVPPLSDPPERVSTPPSEPIGTTPASPLPIRQKHSTVSLAEIPSLEATSDVHDRVWDGKPDRAIEPTSEPSAPDTGSSHHSGEATNIGAPKLSRIHKYNSCSTLFVESTITNADLDDTLRCIATLITNRIQENLHSGHLHTEDILSEELYPFSRDIHFYTREPDEGDIFRFLECLFSAAELTAECGVITLIYVERMLQNTGVTIHSCNWGRTLLGALVLASKVWDDHAVWNVDFVQIFPDIPVSQMNELERWYLSALDFNVNVKPSDYARCYFRLREVADMCSRRWPLKPLTLSDADKLEPRAQKLPERTRPDDEDDDGSSPDTAECGRKVEEARVDPVNVCTLKRSRSDFIFIPSKPPAMVRT